MIVIISTKYCISQTSIETTLKFNESDIKLKRELTLNPVLLAATLTKSKTTDKEKFDAIFAWVTSNISYDFNKYYSSNGSGISNISQILRTRKGICTDYSNLMDTLCTLSQLTNVTIFGYTKDEIFDVNDSIYEDNHAWNAVKLDGFWYLYDATWAAGEVDYQLTRFSRFLLKLSEKFPETYKRKKAKHEHSTTYQCGEKEEPVYYYIPRWFNRLNKSILERIPLRVKQTFTQKINTNFYLTAPEVFAITHFPDNPDWSFLSGLTMRQFETDSLFYHLADSSYQFQNRHGTSCEACENEISMDYLSKQYKLRNQSLLSNKRNQFISSFCEYNIGAIYLNQSHNFNDSLTKIKLLDTSAAFFQLTNTSLKICSRNVTTNYRLQKNKNRYKQTLLLKDNRNHIDFVREKVNLTYASVRLSAEMGNKYKAHLLSYNSRKLKIKKLKETIFVNKSGKESPKKMLKLSEKLATNERENDSLQILIKNNKHLFDSISSSLSLTIWQKVLQHKQLVSPITECIQLRARLKDNFKKTVIENRKQLYSYEENYAKDMNLHVYEPCLKLYILGNNLLRLLDLKEYKEKEIHGLKLSLVKFNQLPTSTLKVNKEDLLEENKVNYCWIKHTIPELNSILIGFENLLKEQNSTLKVILYENKIERLRASQVNKELLRRKNKHQNIVSHNSYLARVKLKEVKKEKQNFLNLLKHKVR